MRHLRSNYRDPRIQVFALDDLSLMMVYPPDDPDYEELTTSIRENGLSTPLIVVEMSDNEWNERLDKRPNVPRHLLRAKFHDDKILAIKFGNVRAVVAEKLGYTHVDCIVFSQLRDALILGGYFAKSYALRSANAYLSLVGLWLIWKLRTTYRACLGNVGVALLRPVVRPVSQAFRAYYDFRTRNSVRRM